MVSMCYYIHQLLNCNICRNRFTVLCEHIFDKVFIAEYSPLLTSMAELLQKLLLCCLPHKMQISGTRGRLRFAELTQAPVNG